MKQEQPDLCVFIGRFEPLHKGHLCVIEEGLRRGKFMVVLVGSAFEPRSVRNPFTVHERTKMIHEAFGYDPRLMVLPLEDSNYNLGEWVDRTYQTVDQACEELRHTHPEFPSNPSVSLIGHAKDATSYYLNLFPRWDSINVPQEEKLSATHIREKVFGTLDMIRGELDEAFAEECAKHMPGETLESLIKRQAGMNSERYFNRYIELAREGATAFLNKQRSEGGNACIPSSVLDFLAHFLETPTFEEVAREYAFAAKYRYAWRFALYEPIFTTTDALVVQAGRILLVKRRHFPGKGLWALPGGFLEPEETLEAGCLRELDEETALQIPKHELRNYIVAREVFDAPFRSSRGRTITHAHLIHLPPGAVPGIKPGGEDEETEQNAFVALSELRREDFFEDHYAIIRKMTAGL